MNSTPNTPPTTPAPAHDHPIEECTPACFDASQAVLVCKKKCPTDPIVAKAIVLTDADLKKLKELEQKAVKGPWRADTLEPYDCVVWGPVEDQFIGNVGSAMTEVIDDRVIFDSEIKNCELVAEMRTMLPALIARLEAAEKAVEVARQVQSGIIGVSWKYFSLAWNEWRKVAGR